MRPLLPIIVICAAAAAFGVMASAAAAVAAAPAGAPATMNTAPTDGSLRLVIEHHVFSPAELRIPAGKRVKLIVENRDDTAEEFDSYDLNREKVIAAKSNAIIWIGPLKPGRYTFVGEFNVATAHGAVLAQ